MKFPIDGMSGASVLTTVTEGGFTYLRVPLTVPFVFFLVMMTSVIALMVVLLVMSWKKRKS